MSIYNIVKASVVCPRCGRMSNEDIEGFMGFRDLSEYCVGDRIQWVTGKSVQKGGRPPDGSIDAEGYSACQNCGKDFFLVICIRNDILVSVEPDTTKPGYIK